MRRKVVRFRLFLRERRTWFYRLGILVALFAVFNLFYPLKGHKTVQLEEGSIAEEDIIAPFAFSILKDDEEFRKEQEHAASLVLPVLVLNEAKPPEILSAVADYFGELEKISASDRSRDDKMEALSELNPMISQASRQLMLDREERNRVRKTVDEFLQGVLSTGVLSSKDVLPKSSGRVIMREKEREIQTDVAELVDLESLPTEARKIGISHFKYDEDAMDAFLELSSIFVDPNLEFDIKEYARRREEAKQSVSRTKGVVLKGEMIVAAHYPVTGEAIEKLRSLELEKERKGGELEYPAIFSKLGRNIIFASLVGLFLLYAGMFKPTVLGDVPALLLLAICFAAVLMLAYPCISMPAIPNYLIPVALASILVALLLDSQLAILLTVVLSLVIGIYTGLRLAETMVSLLAGVVAVFSLRKIRRRAQFYESILFISLAYLVGIMSVEFLKFTPFRETLRFCGFGIVNSFLSVILCMGIAPFFERLFGFTTDITLLELSDLNRPILRELSLKAPGTFHHSLIIGSLAEAASESIKANSLLARVGAYYHDIGKVERPEYFADNQSGMKNPHDKLSPKMSALIIKSHVKDGLAIAKREKLPKPIIDMIAQHHGKTLISYFYNRALEMNPKETIQETDFRYPGPRPSTKEAAIVMLADSVEAAARSLENPTPSRLKGTIKQIITNRFSEMELDGSDLTMKDLHKIAEAFLPVLVGIFHSRPEYPGVTSGNLRRTSRKKSAAPVEKGNKETDQRGR